MKFLLALSDAIAIAVSIVVAVYRKVKQSKKQQEDFVRFISILFLAITVTTFGYIRFEFLFDLVESNAACVLTLPAGG